MARLAVWGLLLVNIRGQSASHQNNSIQDNYQIKAPQLSFIAFLTTQDGGVVCAGTIVHQYYVLTAAGCFHTHNGDMISYQHKVLVGNKYKNIKQLLPHPAYRAQTTYYDVGLIKLSSKIRLGAGVSAVKMAETEQMEVGDVMKTPCWVMNDKRSWLKQETSHIIMRSLCGNAPALGLFITSNLVCARVHNRCAVSNGSPLYDGDRQFGVASKHIQGRTLYIKVNKVHAWIINILYGGNGVFFDEY